MANPRILVVDSASKNTAVARAILEASVRGAEVVCAADGVEAMRQLADGSFDVLVSALALPRVDGIELMRICTRRHPGVVRIAMSDDVDARLRCTASAVAHHFIARPIDADELRDAVDRSLTLKRRLSAARMQRLLPKLGQLPTCPGSYRAIRRAIANPSSTVARVARVVEQDMTIAARVLRLVNSGYYGLPRTISSVEHAIGLLGMSALQDLLLAIETYGAFRARWPGAWLSTERLHVEAVHTGMIAANLVGDPTAADHARTAGLLCRVGMLVLAARVPLVYSGVLDRARRNGEPLRTLELRHLGMSHAEIGGLLLHQWGLPLRVVEAVTYADRAPTSTSATLDVADAVRVARHLVAEGGGLFAEQTPPLDPKWQAASGVAERLGSWRSMARAVRG